MNHSLLFFAKFLRHGVEIASLFPSSRWLSRSTLADIKWEEARIILELGAGTGPVTQEILYRARPDARIFIIERDTDFVEILTQRFSSDVRVEIIKGDVKDLEKILTERGVTVVDCVVSGLPVPSFSVELQEHYFSTLKKFLIDGSYNQITEIPLLYQRFYRRYFESVRFIFEPRNIPPGGVYVCRSFRSRNLFQ